jgi:putative ABC transport system permease protein
MRFVVLRAFLRRTLARLGNLRRSNQADQDLDREIASHLALLEEDYQRRGLSPAQAHTAARLALGGVEQARQAHRDQRSLLWLEYILQDLRFALRSLRRAPGYATAVVLTLALGLGSVATMLAVVDSVLLRPVALPHPNQLVMIYGQTGQQGSQGELSYDQIETLRRHAHCFSAVAGYASMVKAIGTPDGVRWALLTEVTPDFFTMLGVHPARGRSFSANDAAAPVVLVSHDYWQDRLHRDPHVLGSTLSISNTPYTVIGVLPPGLNSPFGTNGPVIFRPISLQGKEQNSLFAGVALVLARMKPGVSTSQALAETRTLLAPHDTNGVESSRLVLQSLTSFIAGGLQTPLLTLLGGVVILLLIACANAANLQIVRATERLPEMQIRSALGAGIPRLLQQLLIESLVVSFAGAAVGGSLAVAATAAIRSAYGLRFARFNELSVHPSVFAALLLLALLSGLLASVAPAWRLRHPTLTAGTRRTVAPRNRVSAFLVSLQIALTCVLLVTCGLFIRTVRALQQVPLGFDPHNVTILMLMPEDSQQPPALLRQRESRLLQSFQALPGVQAAAMQSSIPFSNYNFSMNGRTDVSGRPFHKGDTSFYSIVSSSFVHASGIHLLQGRDFQTQDDSDGAMVALVNQAFVRKFLSGRNPLGVTLRMHRDPGEKDSDVPLAPPFTVVGVVENELQGPLGSSFEPMIYLDDLQLPAGSALLRLFDLGGQFAIRSPLPPSVLDKEIRDTLKRVAPDMAEMQMDSMEQAMDNSLGERRLALRLVSGFGAMALLLAAIGIYGLLAYAVTLRRREIGIRMALGSSRTRVTRLVLRQAARMVLWGVIPGIAGAWAAAHAVRSFLFGVTALDPLAIAAAAGVLALTAAVAAAIPAWRAARVHPMEVLRVE